MINAGKYNKKITIWTRQIEKENGYQQIVLGQLLATVFASVKTTRGMTLIAAGSDFEKAYTNFTIRLPKIAITRDLLIRYNYKNYTIEYINNINEEGVELELQCKEITH
ncbi:MAG: phage head closure protein [Firmicutes bacterium]|nr:phage head closure protein [Bacillota bacterium]